MHPLKPFQKEALEALKYKPAHVLCVAPTGSGKSLIFERRIALGKHRALLISPLVALARQQSSRVQDEVGSRLPVKLGSGRPSEGPPDGPGTWIVSPETLVAPGRKRALEFWRPDFLIVDECHCLWDWGENFRPAFSEIPYLLERYDITRSLWLTATLPLAARKKLRAQLPRPLTEIGEFDLPPTLELSVEKVPWVERIGRLLRWVNAQSGSGVIFTGTRESTERICRVLLAMGSSAVAYHAGLSQEERTAIERMISRGTPRVIVATSAFGMGMNHKHLTWVVLLQPPSSLLGLTQAIGRAGRTASKQAQALILWDDDDFRLLEWTIQGSERRKMELLELRKFLASTDCRRLALKRYFEGGNPDPERCDRCDRCRS